MGLLHDFGCPNCQRFNGRLDFVFELSSGIQLSAPHSHVTEPVAQLAMVSNSQRVFPQDLAFASAWLSAELRPRENTCPFFSNPRHDPLAYSVSSYSKLEYGASEAAQWVKAFVIKPNDPSSIPETHMVERECSLAQIVL